ncbi:ABC transporter permease [Paenibacillus aestuarii]|uniref:Transport permease protein n=1 Tax=Paenibacillus aestuarii TaxID=516965 RepID=A0ABW0K0G2_9BACL|nr:ABC transporter permease [Paenibacillus aestuarii]
MQNIVNMVHIFMKNRDLISQFVKREIIARYKGSYLGIIWSFLNPLLMLSVYTFVFSEIFKAKWSSGVDESKIEFALVLFCGLITFNIFSETVSRAPSLIISNPNYVKKVVFPVEILPIISMGSSLFQFLINLIILFLGVFLFLGAVHWTIVFLPLVLLPIVLLSMGISWFLASLGVYLRDIAQIISIAVQAIMLISPIFYSVSSIPQKFRIIYDLNPISYVVEDMRRIIIWGQLPQWGWLVSGTILSLFIFFIGYFWFRKTRQGFADVL